MSPAEPALSLSNKIRLLSLISRRLKGSVFSDCRDERG